MFSALPQMPYMGLQSSTFHTPAVSSPLSSSPIRASPSPTAEHSGTIFSYDQLMSSPTPAAKSLRDRQIKFSPRTESATKNRRIVKKNPLMHGRGDNDSERETRRKLFLKRVREDAEEKKWERRGGDDELLRSIWVSEQRRLEAKRAREAKQLGLDEASFDEVDGAPPALESMDMEQIELLEQQRADAIARQEEAEMEAMLSLMDAEDTSPTYPSVTGHDTGTPFGSDDEDYDQIFMEMDESDFMDSTVNRDNDRQLQYEDVDQDMMDMN